MTQRFDNLQSANKTTGTNRRRLDLGQQLSCMTIVGKIRSLSPNKDKRQCEERIKAVQGTPSYPDNQSHQDYLGLAGD